MALFFRAIGVGSMGYHNDYGLVSRRVQERVGGLAYGIGAFPYPSSALSPISCCALSPVHCHTVERVVVAAVVVVAVSGREGWKEAKGAQLELIVKSSRTEEEVTLFRVSVKARVPCSHPRSSFPTLVRSRSE